MPTTIRRAGYFHFGRRAEGKPIEHLRKALARESKEGLAESLLVLPEAFNLIGPYDRDGEVSDRVRQQVIEISQEYSLAIVAGLIREDPCKVNASELIDGNFQFCISAKYTLDTGLDYDPVQRFRPRFHRGWGIASLICLDSSPTSDATGHTLAREYCKWNKDEGRKTLLCVPASLGAVESSKITGWWKRQFDAIVLANCNDEEPSLAVARHGGEFVTSKSRTKLNENYIDWVKLPEV